MTEQNEIDIDKQRIEKVKRTLKKIEENGERLQELMSDLDDERGTRVPIAWNGDGSSDDMTQWLQNVASDAHGDLVWVEKELEDGGVI